MQICFYTLGLDWNKCNRISLGKQILRALADHLLPKWEKGRGREKEGNRDRQRERGREW